MEQFSSLRGHAVQTVRFGDVQVSELSFAVAASARPVADAVLELLFVLAGELHLRCRGESLRLQAAQWIACDANAILLSASENTSAVLVTIPSRAARFGSAIHSSQCGLDSVLLAYVTSALKAASDLTAQARVALGDSIIELATLALRGKAAPVSASGSAPASAPASAFGPASVSAPGPARRKVVGRQIMCERVKAFVRNHVRASTLTIDGIAKSFNCTKRYLHKAFSEDERSLNQFIWDLRLDRCSRDLANVDLLERSITEIALGWGFRSTPHFSRVFRQRFGVSPSAYRAEQVSGRSAAALRAPSPRFRYSATYAAYSDTAS